MRTQEKQFHNNLKKLSDFIFWIIMHELLLLIWTQVEEKSSYQEISFFKFSLLACGNIVLKYCDAC